MEINFNENEVNIIRAAVAQLHVLYIIEDVLSVDPVKKAKIFIQGYKILQTANMSMSIKHKETREKLLNIIKDSNDYNIQLSQLLNEYSKLYFGRERILEKIILLVNNDKVSSLIDFFVILIQRRAFFNPEVIKGFSLDGKSGELVKEYLGKPVTEEETLEEELEETMKPEEDIEETDKEETLNIEKEEEEKDLEEDIVGE